MSARNTLVWFTHDLRLDDNWTLFNAAKNTDRLLCVYLLAPNWFRPLKYGTVRMGQHRWRFLSQTLTELASRLAELGQRLVLVRQSPRQAIPGLIQRYAIDEVHRSAHVASDERQEWDYLAGRFPTVRFLETCSHTLFEPAELPFQLHQLPETFSQFRRKVEKTLQPGSPMAAPEWLPPPLPVEEDETDTQAVLAGLAGVKPANEMYEYNIHFHGGERSGLARLGEYFSTDLPGQYKQVRNQLDGWHNSSKLSPLLANGSISVRRLVAELQRYERDVVANESTYWLYFELLWREYFQWYARCHNNRLFNFKGLRDKAPHTSYYPERFQRWYAGETPYAVINACMKQLNATGYLSNRGRQLVASCLVNELQLDWRFGAAYLEQQLIDYEPAVNWGNWQYLAGVGADPRGGRHFNLAKQTALYDPQGEYIRRWQGDAAVHQADSVDCADWPIEQ